MLLDWLHWVRRPTDFLDRKARRRLDNFVMRGLSRSSTIVFFSDPASIRDIFASDPEWLRAGEANSIAIAGIFGDQSVGTLDGEAHDRHRKLLAPAFHGPRMQAYGAAMQRLAAAAIGRWREGETLSIVKEMQALTVDIILHTVFGVVDGPVFTQLGDLLRELLAQTTSPALFGSLLLFAALPREVQSRFSFLSPGKRLIRVLRELDAVLFAEFARRRRELSSAAGSPRADVLSVLLGARDESGSSLSDAEVRDEMVTLLIAGHETSALALAWAIHHLLADAEARSTLEAELASLRVDGSLEPRAVTAAPYLDAVVKETLRLRPVAPQVARVLKKDMRIGGREWPAGVLIMPCSYLTHRRPELWPAPERFRPERFLERQPAPYEFFPFGGGNRRCIGAAFATYEVKVVLSEILTRVQIVPVDDKVRAERRGILLAPSGGMAVRVVRRLGRQGHDVS